MKQVTENGFVGGEIVAKEGIPDFIRLCKEANCDVEPLLLLHRPEYLSIYCEQDMGPAIEDQFQLEDFSRLERLGG